MTRRRLALLLVVLLVAAGLGAGRAAAATPSPTKGVVIVDTNLALQNSSAAGTGIVLTKSGEVLTNNHVIAGATTIKVTVPATKRTYTASVIGYDITDDVALLKLQGASNVATATFGSSAKVRVGQFARAVGNANGRGRLVQTTGKVLALNRTITVQDDNGEPARLGKLIETSARLVPGDSGGPLLDVRNRVIGVDAAGSPTFAFEQNAPGYAIAIDHALTIARQIEALRAGPTVHIGDTAFMGVQVGTAAQGVAVGGVVGGSPAEQAGLEKGDVILTINGAAVSTLSDVRTILFTKHPGDTVTLAYLDVLGNQTSATLVLATGPPQ